MQALELYRAQIIQEGGIHCFRMCNCVLIVICYLPNDAKQSMGTSMEQSVIQQQSK